MANLKRKQVYLDEESDRALKSLAFSTKISEAEHIRRAVRKYITRRESHQISLFGPTGRRGGKVAY